MATRRQGAKTKLKALLAQQKESDAQDTQPLLHIKTDSSLHCAACLPVLWASFVGASLLSKVSRARRKGHHDASLATFVPDPQRMPKPPPPPLNGGAESTGISARLASRAPGFAWEWVVAALTFVGGAPSSPSAPVQSLLHEAACFGQLLRSQIKPSTAPPQTHTPTPHNS